MELEIIIRDEPRKAYIFSYQSCASHLSCQLIAQILELDDEIDSVKAIKILSILNYAYSHHIENFCCADIKYALGEPNMKGELIRVLLAWWDSLGILKYSTKVKTRGYCNYFEYTITSMNPARPLFLDDDGQLSEEYKNLFKNIIV